jgi:hypothetical protein
MAAKLHTRILIFTLALHTAVSAQSFTDSNLPIVVINTNNQTIADDPKIFCDMGIIWNGNGNRNYFTDPFNNYNGKIAIEIRGSTSQQYPKKSYGLETQDSAGNNLNVPLLGMPSDNDWILYGAYPDKTLMRNEFTYQCFSRMHPWSPRWVYCELVINGQYMGVYTLLERIKRDNNRVDIAKLDFDDNAGDSLTGGYIIKVDKTTGNSNTTWTSPYQNKVKYLYHDPEDTELTAQQRNYIKNYTVSFENAVYGTNFTNPNTGYAAYINTASFVDFFLMQELGRTVDGYRSSSFMYKDKDSKGGKLTCGPMWDFNLSFGNADYCDAYDTTGWQYNFATVCPTFSTEPPNWWKRLLLDTNYCNMVKCRWNYLRQHMLHTDSVNAWIDTTAAYLNEAEQRNFIKWPILGTYVNWNYYVGQTYQDEIDYLKGWFQSRSVWMDNNLPGNCYNTGINNVSANYISVDVFPNPFNNYTTFTVHRYDNALLSFKLFDCTGKLISETLTNENTLPLYKNALNAGMYFYTIADSKEIIATGKLIIQ